MCELKDTSKLGVIEDAPDTSDHSGLKYITKGTVYTLVATL